MPPTPSEQFKTADDPAQDRYLSARQVRERFAGASDMWLWRRLNDDSGFPKPFEIAGRRFWKLSELIAWERAWANKSRPAAA